MCLFETRQLGSWSIKLFTETAAHASSVTAVVVSITVSHAQCWQLWDSTLPVLNSLYPQ